MTGKSNVYSREEILASWPMRCGFLESRLTFTRDALAKSIDLLKDKRFERDRAALQLDLDRANEALASIEAYDEQVEKEYKDRPRRFA